MAKVIVFWPSKFVKNEQFNPSQNKRLTVELLPKDWKVNPVAMNPMLDPYVEDEHTFPCVFVSYKHWYCIEVLKLSELHETVELLLLGTH